MSTTTLPDTDPERAQRLTALDRANEIRVARSALKRRIYAGECSAVTVILTVPPEAHGWNVLDLLMSQRRWGRRRSLTLLSQNRIPERELAALSERQRRVLAAALTRAGVLTQAAEEARR